jgi:UDP-glucose 4-epimerase
MAIMVTGGAGYVGSHVVHELVDAGRDVVVLDNLSTGFACAVPSSARLVVGDIADDALVRDVHKVHGVDAIIHMAGSVVVPDSLADPLGYYLNNTVKSRALIASAVGAGIRRFIFSSTAAVYGNPTSNPVDEEAPLRPLSPYGMSKLMTEIMLAAAAKAHDLRHVAMRYFNVAGADPAGRTGQSTKGATHLVKVACEAATGQRDGIDVFGSDYPTRDGTCVRDFIHVTDLAQAHLSALLYLEKGGPSQVLNCGYSRGFSVLEVIAAVSRISGREFPARHFARRPGDPIEIVADCRRLHSVLDWAPRYDDIDCIVRDAFRWEQRSVASCLRQACCPSNGRRSGAMAADTADTRDGWLVGR